MHYDVEYGWVEDQGGRLEGEGANSELWKQQTVEQEFIFVGALLKGLRQSLEGWIMAEPPNLMPSQ